MSKEPFSFGPVAAEYAALGLPVFQLKIKGKEAAVMNWREVATTDPSAALKWWDGDTNRLFNIGVAMGHGIIAIDLDKPKADGEPDGEKSLMEYAAQHGGGIPPTWTFQTGRGGIDATNAAMKKNFFPVWASCPLWKPIWSGKAFWLVSMAPMHKRLL